MSQGLLCGTLRLCEKKLNFASVAALRSRCGVARETAFRAEAQSIAETQEALRESPRPLRALREKAFFTHAATGATVNPAPLPRSRRRSRCLPPSPIPCPAPSSGPPENRRPYREPLRDN